MHLGNQWPKIADDDDDQQVQLPADSRWLAIGSDDRPSHSMAPRQCITRRTIVSCHNIAYATVMVP